MKAIVPAWTTRSLSQNLFDEFDQVFESMLQTPRAHNLSLACDVEEGENYVLFSFDLPGLKEEDLNIEVQGDRLVVSGERKQIKRSDNARTFQSRKYGSFKHHFKLPKSVDRDKVEADYTQGVLSVLLPKTEKELPKKIEIKSKSEGFFNKILKGSSEDNS